MNILNIKYYFKKIFIFLICLFFYPLVFVIIVLRKYLFIKIAIVDASRMGHTIRLIEGYLVASNFYQYKELQNCKIIFCLNSPIANQQSVKMIKRLINIYHCYPFFSLLHKSLIYWKKNDHILNLKNFTIKNLLINHNDISQFYKKPYAYFSEREIKKGNEMISNMGINKKDKWICIHNRDSNYLKKIHPNHNWSYHDYRNFSVNSLKSAAEFFASKGYFVLRMGHLPQEKFTTNDNRILDYANSDYRNDFLDIFLLANCEFYFGGDSGPSDIAYTFMKPAYGVNFTSTLISSGRSHLPWLFTFKRIKNLDNGKLLSLKEILNSRFSSADNMEAFNKNNVLPIENSSKDIKSLAIEVEKERMGQKIEDKEDIIIQNKFWNIFYNYFNKEKMGSIQPKISPSFLRNNLDLLN